VVLSRQEAGTSDNFKRKKLWLSKIRWRKKSHFFSAGAAHGQAYSERFAKTLDVPLAPSLRLDITTIRSFDAAFKDKPGLDAQ
jgi:hypothetical protein